MSRPQGPGFREHGLAGGRQAAIKGAAKDSSLLSRTRYEDTEQDNMRGMEKEQWRGRRVKKDFSEEGTLELMGTGRKTIPGRRTRNAHSAWLAG